MGNLTETFVASNQSNEMIFWLAILFGTFGLVSAILLLWRKWIKDYNYRLLVGMLLFFMGIIGLGTAFFARLTTHKLGPVELYESGMISPYGAVLYTNIKDAYIHMDQQKSLINPDQVQRKTRILIIEEQSGKTHALSEINYPIEEVFQNLKDAVRKK